MFPWRHSRSDQDSVRKATKLPMHPATLKIATTHGEVSVPAYLASVSHSDDCLDWHWSKQGRAQRTHPVLVFLLRDIHICNTISSMVKLYCTILCCRTHNMTTALGWPPVNRRRDFLCTKHEIKTLLFEFRSTLFLQHLQSRACTALLQNIEDHPLLVFGHISRVHRVHQFCNLLFLFDVLEC